MSERKARRSGGNRTSPQTTQPGNGKHSATGRSPVSPQRVRAALAFYAPSAVPRRRP